VVRAAEPARVEGASSCTSSRTPAGPCPSAPGARAAETRPLGRLSPRERDVLALLAEGRSNVGIGRELRLSPKTVEAHVAAIFRAFGLQTDTGENRRVHAALGYLRVHPTAPSAR
jgi:DNA-binding NarL/FixJ family response regulator